MSGETCNPSRLNGSTKRQVKLYMVVERNGVSETQAEAMPNARMIGRSGEIAHPGGRQFSCPLSCPCERNHDEALQREKYSTSNAAWKEMSIRADKEETMSWSLLPVGDLDS